MAEKKKLDVFTKTGPAEQSESDIDISDLEAGLVRPIGIGLREGEIAALDAIAGEYDISRGGVMRIALRLFVRDYRAGKIDLTPYVGKPVPQKNKVILPK